MFYASRYPQQEEEPERDPEVVVHVDPSYREGDRYEWGPLGEKVWGDFIDPAKVSLRELAEDADLEGLAEIFVRPCSWTAGHNGGGIMAVSG